MREQRFFGTIAALWYRSLEVWIALLSGGPQSVCNPMSDLLAPNTVIHGARGDYVILGLIGRGGMGAVYRAQRQADGAIWALKEMRPPPDAPASEVEENRKLFLQEAELLSSLNHP